MRTSLVGNEAAEDPVLLQDRRMTVMRLLLLLAVVALGADALLFSGAYTQAAWREGSAQVEKLIGNAQETARDARQPG
jgi:hypothetical protein